MSRPQVYQERRPAINEQNISKWTEVVKGSGKGARKPEVRRAHQ
jgi:hypothetical protein